jgi:sulfoxide reductase heme-binding subunit YedZ
MGSPLWYASRGLGLALLLVVTGAVVLGVVTSGRWRAGEEPRFLAAGLHRSLSLLALPLLALHGLAVLLDPFAKLGLADVTIPFASAYRPVWLGLGVLAGELLVALAVTSLLRRTLGYAAWRFLHWAAYLAWPLALLHGLGTGSDTRAGWALLVYGASLASVLAAVLMRLLGGPAPRRPWRVWTAALASAAAVAIVGWTAAGPLQPGWARAAGTPPALLRSAALSGTGDGPGPVQVTRAGRPASTIPMATSDLPASDDRGSSGAGR